MWHIQSHLSLSTKSSILSFIINERVVVVHVSVYVCKSSMWPTYVCMYVWYYRVFQEPRYTNPFTFPIRFYIAHEAQNVWPKVLWKGHIQVHWKGKVISFSFNRVFFFFSLSIALKLWFVSFLNHDIQITLTVSCVLSGEKGTNIETTSCLRKKNSSEQLTIWVRAMQWEFFFLPFLMSKRSSKWNSLNESVQKL